jgi:hypothetical protein
LRYIFHNSFDAPFELALEPWADTVSVEPGVEAVFEISGENAIVEFVPSDSGALLFVWGNLIEMTNGEETNTWEPPRRYKDQPPPDNLRKIASALHALESDD